MILQNVILFVVFVLIGSFVKQDIDEMKAQKIADSYERDWQGHIIIDEQDGFKEIRYEDTEYYKRYSDEFETEISTKISTGNPNE